MDGLAERLALRPALCHVTVSMPWHRPLPPASAESRAGVFAAPYGARSLSRQTQAGDDVALRILLLAQFLRILYFFVRLFFLCGLGRFFFGRFLRVLVFAHDFLRLNVAMRSCVIEHLAGNLVGIPWRRQGRRAARGQATNIQQLCHVDGDFGVDLRIIPGKRPARPGRRRGKGACAGALAA